MKPHSRFQTARRILLFWTLFIGLGAVLGAVCMLCEPSGRILGMDAMLPYFQVLPFADVLFQDFTFSGWALLIVNGVSNLTAAALLLAKKNAGVRLGGLFGITLMLWICIQFYMFPLNFMSTIYFVFGLCQALTGYAAQVFARQEAFHADAASFPGIGRDPSRLVVYFSRMGYVRFQAFQEAEQTGAAVYEIRATERTEGTPGFWWCGRYGMHRWDMPIEPLQVDLSAFAHVTICAPIWVFALCAPVRSFCRQAAGQIREADYILVHHTAGRYETAAQEMDALLGLHHTGLRSIQCRTGIFRPIPCAAHLCAGKHQQPPERHAEPAAADEKDGSLF